MPGLSVLSCITFERMRGVDLALLTAAVWVARCCRHSGTAVVPQGRCLHASLHARTREWPSTPHKLCRYGIHVTATCNQPFEGWRGGCERLD